MVPGHSGLRQKDEMLAGGEALTCLSKTVLSSWKGRMKTERCLQKGDSEAADLNQLQSADSSSKSTMMLTALGLALHFSPTLLIPWPKH